MQKIKFLLDKYQAVAENKKQHSDACQLLANDGDFRVSSRLPCLNHDYCPHYFLRKSGKS